MHHANHFYGHADVLARWVGLPEAPRIRGYLQHGWTLHDGFAVGTAFAPGYPKFVWADAVLRRARLAGLGEVHVVGAPFAYLTELHRRAVAAGERTPPARRSGTIVYPFHGWEGQTVRGSHAAYARLVRDTDEGPWTACLYFTDHANPEIRAAYEDNGFRVITHGSRGYMHRGHDTAFLDRQLAELLTHRRVVSNRMGSALLYGAAVGAGIGVYGDPMVLDNDHAVLGGMAKQLRLHPELHRTVVDDEVAASAARTELGTDRLLDPAELADLVGWSDPVWVSGARPS
ncbi:MAG: hypothetical protein ACRCYR_12605 [Phycicoccus sp.]